MEKPNQSRPETRTEQCERLKRAIVGLLGCTEEQYTAFQYNEGRKYLKYYLNEDKPAADQLSRSRIFWNWWKNHWSNRDETFLCLNARTPVKDPEIRLQLYLQYNDGKQLADCIQPNSVVLHESYAHMITEFVKGETEKA